MIFLLRSKPNWHALHNHRVGRQSHYTTHNQRYAEATATASPSTALMTVYLQKRPRARARHEEWSNLKGFSWRKAPPCEWISLAWCITYAYSYAERHFDVQITQTCISHTASLLIHVTVVGSQLCRRMLLATPTLLEMGDDAQWFTESRVRSQIGHVSSVRHLPEDSVWVKGFSLIIAVCILDLTPEKWTESFMASSCTEPSPVTPYVLGPCVRREKAGVRIDRKCRTKLKEKHACTDVCMHAWSCVWSYLSIHRAWLCSVLLSKYQHILSW